MKKLKLRNKAKFDEPDYIHMTLPNPDYLIYFLCQGDVVVYVGQTHSGLYRPYSHHKGKEFDNVKIIPCKLNELDALEKHFIEKYKPHYNIVGVKDTPKLKAL